MVSCSLVLHIFVYFLGSLSATCHRSYHQRSSVLGIATDEDVFRILRMLGFEESHGEQDEFGLDDFRFTLLNHDRTTAIGIGLPINFLNADTCQMTLLTEEFKGVDVPAAGTAFLVRGGGLEGAWVVRPRVLWIDRTFYRSWHNLYLRDALASVSVGGADAVAASVATSDNEHILALGRSVLLSRTPYRRVRDSAERGAQGRNERL